MTHAEAFLSSRRGATPRSLVNCKHHVHVHVHLPSRQDAHPPVPWRHTVDNCNHQCTLVFGRVFLETNAPSVSPSVISRSRPRAHPSTMPHSPPPSKQALQKDRVHYMCCKRAAGGADPITDAYRNHAFAPGATFELDPAHRAPVHHATHAVLALRLYVSLPIASRSTFRTCPAPRRASPP